MINDLLKVILFFYIFSSSGSKMFRIDDYLKINEDDIHDNSKLINHLKNLEFAIHLTV